MIAIQRSNILIHLHNTLIEMFGLKFSCTFYSQYNYKSLDKSCSILNALLQDQKCFKQASLLQ